MPEPQRPDAAEAPARCDGCRFHAPLTPLVVECRFEPPAVTFYDGSTARPAPPKVPVDYWCGRHQPRPKAPARK